jgi:hypothetical protein
VQPSYVKKPDPRERTTWMDRFIAVEPKGGVRDTVDMVHEGRSKAVFTAILGSGSRIGRAAA